MQLKKISNINNDNEFIIIGDNAAYSRTEVFEDTTGHMQESFYVKLLGIINKSKKYKRNIDKAVSIYRNFKTCYPKLNEWFQEDILIRIGDKAQDGKAKLNHQARPYIYCLAMCGTKLDYSYIFSIPGKQPVNKIARALNITAGVKYLESALEEAKFNNKTAKYKLNWIFYRLGMYTGIYDHTKITYNDIQECYNACDDYSKSSLFENSCGKAGDAKKKATTRFIIDSIGVLHKGLYLLKIITNRPGKRQFDPSRIEKNLARIHHPLMREVSECYCNDRITTQAINTVYDDIQYIVLLTTWLYTTYPAIDNFSLLTKSIMKEYSKYLITERKIASVSLKFYLGTLKTFFANANEWDYDNVPTKPIIESRDIPKQNKIIPRYIPENHLTMIMDAVEKQSDPWFRNIIILQEETGIRNDELRRLDINALHYDKDGDPMLYIPTGKTYKGRNIPTSQKAEKAFLELLELRKNSRNIEGIVDRKTNKAIDYLLMRNNKLLTTEYWSKKLHTICERLGFVTQGKGKTKSWYTPHSFRHTIASNMARTGAGERAIMEYLGHDSITMAIIYVHLEYADVKAAYRKAMGKNQANNPVDYISREIALPEQKINADKVYKTCLSIGECYHHPQEKMCPFVDKCYSCVKFKVTQEDLPKLIEKYNTELQLIQHAMDKGWESEIQRHTATVEAVKQKIEKLGGNI